MYANDEKRSIKHIFLKNGGFFSYFSNLQGHTVLSLSKSIGAHRDVWN